MAATDITVETTEIDKGFKKLVVDLTKVKGSFVDVGLFGGDSPADQSILVYGITNEFGTGEAGVQGNVIIPPRPFLRSTVDENRRSYEQAIDTGLTQIGLGRQTAESVLTRLGIRIRQDISRKIRDLRYPPNKPSTIETKNSSNPLVDTGTLRKAIAFKLGKVFSKKTGKILG
jgi:hypothetical protein